MAEKKKTEKAKKKTVKTKKADQKNVKDIFDPYQIIKFPLTTEKGVRLMEAENKLLFVVDRSANKDDIKKAIEEMFKVKVESVKTFISTKAQKRAYVKFSVETPAIDVATQLGLI